MTFVTDSTPQRISDSDFSWTPKNAWNQGLGAYGGLTFATIIRATAQFSAHPIRRLSVELCAPILDQRTVLSVHRKRQGGRTDFISAELKQGDAYVALAHATCAADRANDLDRRPTRELPRRSGHILSDDMPMPPFTQFFEYEPTIGQLPMGGSKDPVLKSGGWLNPRFDAPRDHALVAALMDAWWPAVMGAARGPRPMGTMSFAIDFLGQPTNEPGPFYLEVCSAHVSDGYSLEIDELWDHTGQCLARAQQNIAVIR